MGFDTLKLCGVAVVAAGAAMLLRELKKEFEIPVRLTATVMLLLASVAMAEPVVSYFNGLLGASPIAGETAEILLRVLGISILSRTAGDICREMGATSVASSLEVAAKLEIIVLTLPLVTEALDAVKGLLLEAGI